VIAEMIEEIGMSGERFDSRWFRTIVSHGVKKALIDGDERLLAPLLEIGMEQVLRDYSKRAVRRVIDDEAAIEAFIDPFRLEVPHVNPQ
jgi:hypothetical protein